MGDRQIKNKCELYLQSLINREHFGRSKRDLSLPLRYGVRHGVHEPRRRDDAQGCLV